MQMFQTQSEHSSPGYCPTLQLAAYPPHYCSILGRLFFLDLDNHMTLLHLHSSLSSFSQHKSSMSNCTINSLSSLFSIQDRLSMYKTEFIKISLRVFSFI